MGSLNAAALQSLAALDVGNAPSGPDPCRGLRDQFAAVTAERDRLVSGIRALAASV